METDIYSVDETRTLAEVYDALGEGTPERRQRLYPVLDTDGALIGVLPWSVVLAGRLDRNHRVADVMVAPTAVAHPDEILRSVADRMAGLNLGVLPVVDRDGSGHLDGLITQFNLLQARQKLLEEERHAERVLTLRRVSSAQTTDNGAPDDTGSSSDSGSDSLADEGADPAMAVIAPDGGGGSAS